MVVTGEEAGECPVDPAPDDDHGDHVGEVALHHVSHHCWICQKKGQGLVGLLGVRKFVRGGEGFVGEK